jgi:cytochrome b
MMELKPLSTDEVRVWDPAVRLFHWTLVCLVACAWISYKFGDTRMIWHQWNGIAILVLVVFRLLWGFFGSSTARFRTFVKGPAAVLAYLRAPARTLGHNPVGALMVLALLAGLAVQGGFGLFATDDVIASGPLYHTVPSKVGAKLTTFHRIGFWVVVGLVATHVAAIVTYLLRKKENLIRPMITGRKPRAGFEAEPAPVLRSPLLAAAALLVAAGLVWGGMQAWPKAAAALAPPKPAKSSDDW